jgi:hypothetical protein
MDDLATLENPEARTATPTERSSRESLMLAGLVAAFVIPIALLSVTAGKIMIFKLGLYRPEDWSLAAFGDFDAFIVAAQLLAAGRYACLYAIDCVGPAQAAYSGLPVLDIRMTWNYPPTMDLLILPAAWIPPHITYGLVLLGNCALVAALAAYLRPSGPTPGIDDAFLARAMGWLPVVLFVCSPSTITGTAIGQTGILTAAIALFGLTRLRRSAFQAGCILGLLAIKPHLALVLPFVVLGQRNRRYALHLVAGALVTIAALVGASLIVFGAAPWGDFLGSLGDTRTLFVGGGYSRTLMMAAYVSLVAAGVPEPLALGLQVAFAVVVGALVVALWRSSRVGEGTKIGLTLMAMPLASPYIYYYDFACWFVGLAMLVRAALADGRLARAAGLACCVLIPWFATLINLWVPTAKRADWPFQPVGLLMVAVFCLLWLRSRTRSATVSDQRM